MMQLLVVVFALVLCPILALNSRTSMYNDIPCPTVDEFYGAFRIKLETGRNTYRIFSEMMHAEHMKIRNESVYFIFELQKDMEVVLQCDQMDLTNAKNLPEVITPINATSMKIIKGFGLNYHKDTSHIELTIYQHEKSDGVTSMLDKEEFECFLTV